MKILYGSIDNKSDISVKVYSKCMKESIIYIPASDKEKIELFGDSKEKSIFVNNIEYYNIGLYIDTETSKIYTNKVPDYILKLYNIDIAKNKLNYLHNSLKLNYGLFKDEYPEQLMSMKYLTGSEKVLEIGGNIGRNSLIIGSIVDNTNFVSLETHSEIYKQLTHNRDTNNMKFNIENSALSKRKLIQKGWETIPSESLLDGYINVNTISFIELKQKYNIDFDTLILDCEGAFYYILMDMPEILDNIQLIIMENDYNNINHKLYIDTILKNKFYIEYSEGGGWGPCSNNFYEVWKRNKDN
jgi:FkbM family methyltransferase